MSTILLIEEDDDARPLIRHNLGREGFDVLVAVDEQSAHGWLAAGCGRAAMDEQVPVVVIADKYGDGLEGTNVPAGEGEWVAYMEDAAQLHQLLARLTHRWG